MSVAVALQKSILALLKAELEPAVAVYQDAPENAAFPFVRIDRVARTRDDTHSTRLAVQMVTVSVHSRVHGSDEAHDILGDIKGVLHNAAMTLESGELVGCRVARSDVSHDAEESSYVGTMVVRAEVHA
jgi:hypothetical protein